MSFHGRGRKRERGRRWQAEGVQVGRMSLKCEPRQAAGAAAVKRSRAKPCCRSASSIPASVPRHMFVAMCGARQVVEVVPVARVCRILPAMSPTAWIEGVAAVLRRCGK